MTDKDRARERMNYLIDQPQKLGRAGMPRMHLGEGERPGNR